MVATSPLRISVVATVRNERSSIGKFVESLLKQAHKPDEIIIVDGASSDGTLEILKDYAQRGAIRLISRDCNIAQGRNLGIEAAQTPYIAVTDAGCDVDPNWVKEIVSCFGSHPEVDVVAANFKFETQTRFEEAVIHATFSAPRDRADLSPYHPSSRSVAFTKQAWAKAGGYPEWLYAAEDTLFNIKLRRLGYRFIFCPTAVVTWRPRETWKALAKQRINFSRGNARIDFGTSAYLKNLRLHLLILSFLLLGLWQPICSVLAVVIFAGHLYRNLWPQVKIKVPKPDWAMRGRVLLVMEFVRLVQIYGFLAGRWDRLSDKSFIAHQCKYMGVATLTPPSRKHRPSTRSSSVRRNALYLAALSLFVVAGTVAAVIGNAMQAALVVSAMLTSALFTVALGAKSIADFTHTGPRLKDEILTHYRRYTLFAFLRLLGFAFTILCLLSLPGIVSYFAYARINENDPAFALSLVAGTGSILLLTALQFSRHLLWLPANIAASYNYRLSRLHPYWRRLSPLKLRLATYLLLGLPAALVAYTVMYLLREQSFVSATAYACVLLFYLVLGMWLRPTEPTRAAPKAGVHGRQNILMIGSDTLRADRLDGSYPKNVAPFLREMAARGRLFSQCYVPCARTAPSLLSLLTGCWPHRFGVRDNFVPDEGTRLVVTALPRLLQQQGYRTAALSDWCGADMGKFDLGFDYIDVPEDQWNIKLFIRQGPKDLRLFLSLFARNCFGKHFLPEIYYLGGVPQTDELGREARHLIDELAAGEQPFFLNLFFSTTHGPFGSEYPYYTRHAEPGYEGESKFVMARVTDPWDIIRRQAEPREEFDLDQIIHLYDGCVTRFDDEVKRIVTHLERRGLHENTIVVVYSDHGMEFFEHHTWGQGNSAISDVSNRIPLLVVAPGLQPGETIAQPIRSVDLAPTLIELAGLKCTAEMDGTSLKPSMTEPQRLVDLDAYSETGIWLTDLPGMPAGHLRYPRLLDLLTVRNIATGTISIKPEYEEPIVRAKDRMIRSGRWKLVYQPLEERHLLKLFDMAADPACLHDVSAVHPEVTQALWQRLRAWIASDPLMARDREEQAAFDMATKAIHQH